MEPSVIITTASQSGSPFFASFTTRMNAFDADSVQLVPQDIERGATDQKKINVANLKREPSDIVTGLPTRSSLELI